MKSTLLDGESSLITSIQDSLNSKWIWLLILFPAAACFCLFWYQDELARFAFESLPKEPDKGIAFYEDLTRLWFTESLWLTGFLLLALIIFRSPLPSIFPLTAFVTKSSARWVAGGIAATGLAVACIIAYKTLDRFANSSDEYVYLYQGKTLSEGKLWDASPAQAEFYSFNHIAHQDEKRVGRFPPGWPAILAGAFAIGFPTYFVNAVLGLIAVVIFYFFARKFYNTSIALWSTASVAFTGYFLFNAASFFSHVSCMLLAVSFVYSMHLYYEQRNIRHALLAGLFLGVMVTIRYLTAVIIFLPFFLYTIYLFRLTAWRPFLWMALGGAIPVLLMAWYNYAITGNPLVPVTLWAYDDEGLGFVRGHTPIKGVEHVVRWTFMFLYWCSPALLILYVVFLWKKIRDSGKRFVHPEAYIYLLLVVGYFFYYEIGGNQYGPRFFLEAFPFLTLFVVASIFEHRNQWVYALFLAGFVVAMVKVPFIASREHKVVMQRQDIYRQVSEKQISDAVVFIDSHTGVIRTMPPGDLTRNDFPMENNVLYVHDRGEANVAIMKKYPQRSYFRYSRNPDEIRGRLIRLTAVK